MSISELDPLFVRGLRLLHSKSKDSADQLKQLLDDAIAQSKQIAHAKDRIYTSVKLEGDSKLHIKKASREIAEASSFSSKHSQEDRERKAEKRHFEKAKLESLENMHEAKIPKLESPQVYSYYPPSPDIPKLEQYVLKKDEDTDSSDENADADDFAMEMGLACVICKQIDVTQGNQLIECQECHSLYHQECHRPPATDYDVNDPRRVWYCAKCVKNMKKMATKTQKTSKSVVSVTVKEPVSQTKCTKNDNSPPAQILPFKRTEVKPTISQANNQTANKPIGLAGLAANFGNRTTVSTSSTSLTSSTRGGAKVTPPGLGVKSHSSFSSTTKTSSLSSSTSHLSKITTSTSAFQPSLSTSSSQAAVTSSKTSTTSASVKGLGLLSAAVASASARSISSGSSGNGNTGHKVASCSPLMSADKRLQIMKKKASKLQEKRRLSSK